jgi:hypothetical protein
VVLTDEDGKQRTYKVPFDHRSGQYKWDEKRMLSPKTAEVQADVAGAKKEAVTTAESEATAKIDLPRVESEAEYLKNLVSQAIEHPGFSGAVGAPSWGKAMAYVPGTPEADFMSVHKQITGKNFMQAYQTLKGGGQITEVEGQKATEALSRLNTATSEKAYKEAAEEFLGEIDRLTKLAEKKAGKAEDSKKISGWSIRKL